MFPRKLTLGLALDNTDHALAVFSRQYAEVKDKNNFDRGVYSVNQATSTAGGTWGARVPVTPEPFNGFPETPTPAALPSYINVVLAGDPASGSVIGSYTGAIYTDQNIGGGPGSHAYIAHGTVGGIGAGSDTGRIGFRMHAAAGSGSEAIVGFDQPAYGVAEYVPSATDSIGAYAGIGSVFTDFTVPNSRMSVAAGGGPTGFAVAGFATTLWTRGTTGTWTPNTGVWTTGSLPYAPFVAANCRGDALAALYMKTPGQVYVSDYAGGVTEPCGGAAGTPTPTPTATTTPTVTTTPTATAPPAATETPTATASTGPTVTATSAPTTSPSPTVTATTSPSPSPSPIASSTPDTTATCTAARKTLTAAKAKLAKADKAAKKARKAQKRVRATRKAAKKAAGKVKVARKAVAAAC